MPDDQMSDTAPQRTLQIDVAKYQAMIDDPSSSEDQKREFIEVLWQVIVAFVHLGFKVHPMQLACGQVKNAAPENHDAAANVLALLWQIFADLIFTGFTRDVLGDS